MPKYAAAIRALLPELIPFRHDLHAHPETAFEEHRTSSKVLEALRALPGLDIRDGLAGGTGIVATLNADREGPCVLLRADMDALPIEEMNEVPYRSTHSGKMHACGHDGHTTCLLGAARVLTRMADELPGKIKFCFQPAEEDGGGGLRMIEDGVLENPHVDAAFALHGWPEASLGTIIARPGPTLAAAAAFEVDLLGKGGHAAYPHLASDVLTAAAQFITAAQTIRTRFIDPLDPVVISFCMVEGGFTHNVLPQQCHLKGTIRALSEKAHSTARHLLQRLLQNVAASFEIQSDFRLVSEYPLLSNDARCAQLIADVAHEVVDSRRVLSDYPPSMGGEDFAFYAQRIPAALFRVGLRPEGSFDYPSLHNPRFNFNDDALATAIHMHCKIVERFLTTFEPEADK